MSFGAHATGLLQTQLPTTWHLQILVNLFIKYFLSGYYAPGTVLSGRNKKRSALTEVTILDVI